MRRLTVKILALALTASLLASQALAWGTLAHCVLAAKGGATPGRMYHSSPDYFPSRHLGWEDNGVTNEFCWTHEVQRTSAEPMPWHRIMRPTYYANETERADNSASVHMNILLSHKMLQRPEHVELNELRVGWAAHNREDQANPYSPLLLPAHFDFFPAPRVPEEVGNWGLHSLYESYCDVLVYVFVCWFEHEGTYEAAVEAAFDSFGNPTTLPTPYDCLIGASTGTAITDGLICLSMKVFRKKQQAVDNLMRWDPGISCWVYEGLDVQTRIDITASRTSHIDLSHEKLLWFSRSTFDAALNWLNNHPAGQSFWDYWNAAVAAASEE